MSSPSLDAPGRADSRASDSARFLATYHVPNGSALHAYAWCAPGEVIIEVSSHGILHRARSLEDLERAMQDVVSLEPVPEWDPDDTEVDPEVLCHLRTWLLQP